MSDIPIMALAKREEEIYVTDREAPIKLSPGPGLYLLQRLRDEAHRFAVTYHRRRRGRQMRASLLDGIKGVGPKRKAALLKKFGSVKAIAKARPEEVAACAGVSRQAAVDIIKTSAKAG